MTWKLWLDDQLDDPSCPPRHTPKGFIGAIASNEAKDLIKSIGFPCHVDFDHDLGGSDNAMSFLNWLRDSYDLSTIEPFTYDIHSSNPVGRDNIISFMETWKKVFNI